MLPVAVLAGGLATRLGGLTRETPKSLVEVAGRPFIFHQLDLLSRHAVSDVVLCVGHLGDRIEAAVGDGAAFGLRVRYSYDGPVPLGTGGALKAALPLLGQAFLVLYGDSYLDCDYKAVAAALEGSPHDGVMTVLRNDDRWDRSNIVFRDGAIARYDKGHRTPDMHYIDYGLGGLRRAALEGYPPGQPFDLSSVYRTLIDRNALAGYEVFERFYEIGSETGLAETRRHLAAAPGGVR